MQTPIQILHDSLQQAGWSIVDKHDVPTALGWYLCVHRDGYPVERLRHIDKPLDLFDKFLFFRDVYCYYQLPAIESAATIIAAAKIDSQTYIVVQPNNPYKM